MNRKLLRVAMKGVLALVVALGVLVLARHRLVSIAVVRAMETRTGCPVHVRGLTQRWNSCELTVAELEVGNPKGFSPGRALLLRKLRAHWSFGELFHGRLRLVDAGAHLAVVNHVQSRSGAVNLDPLVRAVETSLDRGELRVDRLVLSLGEVRCVNEARPDHAPLVAHGRGGDHVFEPVASSQDLARVVRTMLTQELPSNLPGILGTTLENAIKDLRKLF